MAFEHRHRISVDEGMIPRYSTLTRVKVIFEIRTNFKVQGRIDGIGNVVERLIDSERFALNTPSCPDECDEHLNYCLAARFKDYWMPDDEIKPLILEVILFAKQIAGGGRRGRIPVAVDLDVCTVLQAGEGNDAAADRAMRPEFLPPLHIYPVDASANPGYNPRPDEYLIKASRIINFIRINYYLVSIRVGDMEKGLGAVESVEVCPICERKPVVGTRISTLRCGHAFHYHCIVRRLVEGDISCPICGHPAHDPPEDLSHRHMPYPGTEYGDYTDYVSEEDEFSDDD